VPASVEFNGEDDHIHLIVEYRPPCTAPSGDSLKGVSSRQPRQRLRLRTRRNHPWALTYFASCGGAPPSLNREHLEHQLRPT